MERRKFVCNSLVFIAGLGLVGCQHEYRERPYERRHRAEEWQEGRWHRNRYNGPPPSAPHNGYRHRHASGRELIYDSSLGAYLVAGTAFYFYSDRFYRIHNGEWESSRDYRKNWRRTSDRGLPPGLRRKHRWRRDDDDRRRGRRDRY